MNSKRTLGSPLCQQSLMIVMLAISVSLPMWGIAEDPKVDHTLKAIQGKWVRQQQTPQGPIRILKEHKGNQTIVTAYDAQGQVVYAHESEFKLETIGKIRVLTFFDRKITAGQNAGQMIKQPTSFLYRVDGKRFIEAHGLLENDTVAPVMILWERPQNEASDLKAT